MDPLDAGKVMKIFATAVLALAASTTQVAAAEYVCGVNLQPTEFSGAQVQKALYASLNSAPNCGGGQTASITLCSASAVAADYPKCPKHSAMTDIELSQIYEALVDTAQGGFQVVRNTVACNDGTLQCASTITITGQK
jgi:hypothetical protein